VLLGVGPVLLPIKNIISRNMQQPGTRYPSRLSQVSGTLYIDRVGLHGFSFGLVNRRVGSRVDDPDWPFAGHALRDSLRVGDIKRRTAQGKQVPIRGDTVL